MKKLSEINELRESFARIGDGLDPLLHEYNMLQEAKNLNIPLDSYRRLYELKDEESVPTYPKFQLQKWWTTPGHCSEWFAGLTVEKKWLLVRKVVAKCLEKGVLVSAVVALGHYLYAIPGHIKQEVEQHKQAQYQAWQTIDLAYGKPGAAGRMSAMEYLNNDKISLEGVNVDNANLSGINLQSAVLKRASLQNTNLEEAHLEKANLIGAKLEDTTFYSAYLQEANFNGADLKDAKFNGADLTQTNFTDTRNLTPGQVTVANHWQLADYDVDFLTKQLDPLASEIHYAFADFRSPSIKTQNLSITTKDTMPYNNGWSQGRQLIVPGVSYVEITFNLDSKPTHGSLLLSHVTSRDSRTKLGGYAPVDISINGISPNKVNSEHLNQGPYNPAEHHDFTDCYATDVFPITKFLHKGSNTIRVQLDKNANTKYWIQTLLVHWS